MNILSAGKLRERVKSGAVSAQDARKALLALRAEGEFVGESVLKWLANFKPRRAKQEQADSQPKKNKRRQRRRN